MCTDDGFDCTKSCNVQCGPGQELVDEIGKCCHCVEKECEHEGNTYQVKCNRKFCVCMMASNEFLLSLR